MKTNKLFLKNNVKKYLETKGVRCLNPICKGDDLMVGMATLSEDGTCRQEITCRICGAEWVDVYKLTNVEEVK